MTTPFDSLSLPVELREALEDEIVGRDTTTAGLVHHHATHATSAIDAITVANTTAVNATVTATNQSTTPVNNTTTATNQAATATNQATTSTNQAATATNQTTTATNQAVVQALHVRYEAPIASELVTVAAQQTIADGILTLGVNPDFPRKLNIDIVDADSSVTAGTLTIAGKGSDGQSITDAISLTGGTATKTSTKSFATVTSLTVSDVTGATGSDKVSVGVAASLGLPSPQGSSAFTVYKACVDNVDEAVGTVDATAKTISPTSAPDASNTYDFWYTVSVSITQDSHNHTQDSHNHTQDSHNHTQDSHNHTQDTHNHTQNAHTHTQDTHNHTQTQHTHTVS